MTGSFNTTRWTLVLNARGPSPEARAVLSDLCAAYYAPVVAFLRREGREEDAARELAHGFFEQVLAAGSVGGAVQGLGRFRSYLLGAVKHFVMNDRRAAARMKRGGEAPSVSMDDPEAGVELAGPEGVQCDAVFDREWAMAVVERALRLLQAESDEAGTPGQFASLRPWLTPAGNPSTQAAVAEQLGISEAAVKVAIHRLRKRFRELVRTEVAQTLNDPTELDDEMRHLVTALV